MSDKINSNIISYLADYCRTLSNLVNIFIHPIYKFYFIFKMVEHFNHAFAILHLFYSYRTHTLRKHF